MIAGVARGPEIDDEGGEVEGEDEGNGPFQDGGGVVGVAPVCGDEGNC